MEWAREIYVWSTHVILGIKLIWETDFQKNVKEICYLGNSPRTKKFPIMPTILLIEDNRDILENTTELLEMEGYTVITAANGEDGFLKICSTCPNLIVCDILMPQISGLELLGKLGTHPQFKKIPVIFYSAKSEKTYIKKVMDMGAYDYIVKPTDLSDLFESIRKCLKDRVSS